MENNQDEIVKMFRDGLATHEMPISEGVWAGIQSSLAASGVSVSSGMAMIKGALVVGITAIVAVGTVNEVRLMNGTNRVAVEAKQEKQSLKENREESVAEIQEDEWAKKVKEVEARARSSEQSFEKALKQPTASVAIKNTDLEVEQGRQSAELSEFSALEEEELAANDREEIKSTVANEPAQNQVIDENKETQREAERAQDNQRRISELEKNAAVCSIKLTHKASAVISPDGDGTNDCFEIMGKDSIRDFKIRIWTQAGEQLFESNDPNFKWCGTNRFGNLVDNQTVCYYQIIAFDDSKTQYSAKNAKGSITVFR